MWDGHLEQISLAKHRIYLTSVDNGLVHSTIYRADLNQGQLEKDKIYKMTKDVVVEPATTK